MQCNICLKETEDPKDVAAAGQFFNVLQKYFTFAILLESNLTACSNCYDTIMDFEAFIDQIEQVHAVVQDTSDDMKPFVEEFLSSPATIAQSHVPCDNGELDQMLDGDSSTEQMITLPPSIVVESDVKCEEVTIAITVEEDVGVSDPDECESSEYENEYANPTIHEMDSFIQKVCKMQCGACKLDCRSFASLEYHAETVHKSKAYVICCGRKFAVRRLLYEHARLHQCNICSRIFANNYNVKNHMVSKHQPSERKVKCNECGKCFTNDGRLKQHMRSHVSVKDRGYQCDACHKNFATIFTLRYHVLEHHKEEWRYMCDTCGKGFYLKHAFDLHVAEHLDSKPDALWAQRRVRVSCTICSKTMKQMSLRKHMMEHEDPNAPYRCDICGKDSPSKGAHLEHKRFVHLLEKIHKCAICGKGFKKAITLKEHMALHTGKPLYTCPYCSKTFNGNGNLYSHKKKSHREQWDEEQRDQYSTEY